MIARCRAPDAPSPGKHGGWLGSCLRDPRLTALLLLLGGCRATTHAAATQMAVANPPSVDTASTGVPPASAQSKGKVTPPPDSRVADNTHIAAVVNGDVITNNDIDNRARLFAMSTGLAMSPEVLDRLKPQIRRQLIDERLRVQEAQRRKIVIQDVQIAEAIHDIERRNNLPPGALRQKLAADGISQRTLIESEFAPSLAGARCCATRWRRR